MNDAASMAIALPGPVSAISTPASTGPRTIPVLWDMPISALACCRCSGGTTFGIKPPAAGRKNASAAP